jgi:hypothetical protein
MRHIFAILFLVLCACSRTENATPPLLPAFDGYSCPNLPRDSGYSVQAQLGPDYTICTLTPLRSGLLPAEILVGGHWSLPDNTRFAGFSKTPIGHVAWFYGVRDNSVRERMAFLPTGLDRPSDVLLVIYGGSLQEATLQREPLLAAIVRASMRPNNSFKPKPLRGSA